MSPQPGALVYTERSSDQRGLRSAEEEPRPNYSSLFQERTTFHGIRDFHLTRVAWARIIWAMIIAAAMFAAIHGCVMIVKEYLTRPLVVSFVIEEASELNA